MMKIETLTSHKDIIAVATLKEGPADEIVRTWAAGGADGRLPEFAPMLAASVRLLLLETKMPHLRVVVGGNTIVVQREHGYIIAACITTGHDIAKSLHRMIRRAAKPARGKREVDGG